MSDKCMPMFWRLGLWTAGALVALALGLASVSRADASGTVTNCTDYGSASTPGTLAWALVGGGTVTFACSGTIVVPLIILFQNTVIDGTGQSVTLSGGGVNPVLFVDQAVEAELRAITVANANGGTWMEGIHNTGTLALTNSIVSGSRAFVGGAALGLIVLGPAAALSGERRGVPADPAASLVAGGAPNEGQDLHPASAGAHELAQATPASPGAVPPNASRIIARVLRYGVSPPRALPPGVLQDDRPPVPPGPPLYSLRVEIQSANAETPGFDNLAQPGTVVEALSSDVLPVDLAGKTIEATLRLTGDTRGVRWWASNIRVLP